MRLRSYFNLIQNMLHYQNASAELVFRYDNAPHHPEIATHPHHKHMGRKVEATHPPHLGAVLREIDQFLYKTP